jgi:precorrin-6x reductase
VERLPRDERRTLQVEDRVHDVADRSHAAERVGAGECRILLALVRRRFDDAERDCIDPHVVRRILDRE